MNEPVNSEFRPWVVAASIIERYRREERCRKGGMFELVGFGGEDGICKSEVSRLGTGE